MLTPVVLMPLPSNEADQHRRKRVGALVCDQRQIKQRNDWFFALGRKDAPAIRRIIAE